MKDRAFISGKAIAQIHAYGALRSDRFKYPIPEFPWRSSPGGLLHFMREVNLSAGKDISETPANMLWMSALLMTTARAPTDPPSGSPQVDENDTYKYRGRLGTSCAVDDNILLAWYVDLGARGRRNLLG